MTSRIESSEIVVTLVHGTFAKGSAWTKDGSTLQRSLRDAMPSAVFETFQWSGWNTHGARLRAGVAFAAHLSEQAERHPAAKRIVIAHSHGGNVALYGAKAADGHQTFDGLVCLATPFIKARDRRRLSLPYKIALFFAVCSVVNTLLDAWLGGRSAWLASLKKSPHACPGSRGNLTPTGLCAAAQHLCCRKADTTDLVGIERGALRYSIRAATPF